MKGIAHFAGGIAAASLFPEAVTQAAGGYPVLFMLAGACGLLPDTLDFKFARYFCRYDMEIAPDPLRPDAAMIAEAVALAVSAVAEQRRSVCLKLHTVRLGHDQWLAYKLRFKRAEKKIEVVFGETVDSGGKRAGMPPTSCSAAASLACDITVDYGYEVEVGFLEGPTIQFVPNGEAVAATFLHWHRAWSHSLLMAFGAGLLTAAALGRLAGIVAFLAVLQHIVVDQLGFMGSNLYFPFERKRRAGMRVAASGDMFWNLAFVWAACTVTLWNIGISAIATGGFLNYAFWGCVVPVMIVALLVRN